MASTLKDRLGRRIKLRDLHVLLAVAEHGSLSKAAHEMAISPPVVSKTISDLEVELGVRLFDRDRNGAVPTPYGRALLDRSAAAFDELRQGIQDIEFLTDPTSGEVRIGGSAAMIAGLLPTVIGEMRHKYPRLSILVTQILSNPSLYYDALRSRTYDLIIGRLPGRPLEDDLLSELLFYEPLSIVAGCNNSLAKRRKIALSDLLNEPWVLPQPGTEVASIVDEIFLASNVPAPIAPVICSSFEMHWSLLATGKFVATMPLSLLKFATQRNSIKELPIKLPAKRGSIGIVTLRNRALSPGARLFIEKTRAVVEPLKT
jgi:DNA-binding transcriptional LysR family regulator